MLEFWPDARALGQGRGVPVKRARSFVALTTALCLAGCGGVTLGPTQALGPDENAAGVGASMPQGSAGKSGAPQLAEGDTDAGQGGDGAVDGGASAGWRERRRSRCGRARHGRR